MTTYDDIFMNWTQKKILFFGQNVTCFMIFSGFEHLAGASPAGSDPQDDPGLARTATLHYSPEIFFQNHQRIICTPLLGEQMALRGFFCPAGRDLSGLVTF